MIVENEQFLSFRNDQNKFRRGENPNLPYGGNISKNPFPRALYQLALVKGFETQTSLARALGKKTNTVIGYWYRKNRVPSPDELGKLIILLDPDENQMNNLLKPYGKLLEEKARKKANLINPSKTPLGQWFVQYSQETLIPLRSISKVLGINIVSPIVRDNLGKPSIDRISQNAPQELNLTKSQEQKLQNSCDESVKLKISEGHKYNSWLNGNTVRLMQRQSAKPTFNGAQAGRELGVSRETISNLRKKFQLPLLLTQEHINFLEFHLKKSESYRFKAKKTFLGSQADRR